MPLTALSVAGGAAVLWAALYLAGTAARLPAPGAQDEAKLATVLYAKGGQELARYYRENRSWVRLRQVAPAARHALLATEDHRFYDHAGVDWRRFVSAAVQTARGHRQGGSTITMQLARNRYEEIAGAAPLGRKAREVLMALKMERAFSKREILEAYFNTVSFGHGAFGIEAAAQTYFGVPAARLGPAQAALLVGMLKGPTRYSPTRHPARARARRNTVLGQMRKRGFLPAREARRLQREPLALALQRPSLAGSPAPYFAEEVRRRLERWAEKNDHDLYTDGLQVHTTLDLGLQRQARASLRRQAEKLEAVAGYEWSRRRPALLSERIGPYAQRAEEGRFEPFARLWDAEPALARDHARRTARYRQAVRHGANPDTTLQRLLGSRSFMDSLRAEVARLEAGLVAMEPQTGAVRAWVGGRSFQQDKYDKVSLARRQPGSTFKPFVWASALGYGFSPYDELRGGTLQDPFRPTRQASGGGLSLRDGLAHSSNRMALALTRAVGPHTVARTARRFGIQSPLREVSSLALGTSEVTLLEMTTAYATLADAGFRHAPHLVTRIEDAQGRLLQRFAPTREKVASQYTAYTTLDLMRGVIDRGTGFPIRRDWALRKADFAGKTGTTQNNADGWFMLMHPQLIAGAWVGFNDRRVAFRTEHWGHGSSNALRIAGDFFQHVLAERPAWTDARFTPPPGYRAPAPPRPVDSLYAGYETVGDGYGADPRAGDHRVRDAFGQGLDSARAGLSGDEPLSRRDADPETAFREALPARPPADTSAPTDATRAPAPAAPAAPSRAPGPVRAGSLDERIGTRRGSDGGAP